MAKTSILTILIQLNKAGNGDKEAIKGLAQLQKSINFGVGAFAALTGAAIAVDKGLQATVGTFVDYASKVREMSRLTGASAEETSKLIQAADDVTISYESLQKALWFASKNGVEVNIDSIARLADEYNALAGPTERAEFLSTKFGKGGADMAKLLEQGAGGVHKLTDAISDDLVLTDAAVKAAREYEIQLDQLHDQVEATRIGIGQGLVPAINNFLFSLNNRKAVMEEANRLQREGIAYDAVQATNLAVTNLKMREYTQGLDSAGLSYRAMAEAAKASGVAVDDSTASQDRFNAQIKTLGAYMGGDLGQAQDDYNAKIAEYTAQLAEARGEEDKRDIQSKIDAETEAYNKRAAAIMFNIQEEAIMAAVKDDPSKQADAVAVLGQLAESYGLIDEAQKHAMVSSASLTDMWLSGTITSDEYTRMLQAQTRGVQENSGALNAEDQQIFHTGERALDTVGKFAEMKEAQAGLGEGINKGALPAVAGLKTAINGLPATGTSWAWTYSISGSGSFPRMPTRGTNSGPGAGQLNNAGVDSEFTPLGLNGMAAGGQMGPGWKMVGEAGYELISPTGYVFTNAESKALMASGLVPEFKLAYGSDGDPNDWGYYSGQGPVVQAARNKNKKKGSSPPPASSGGSNSQSQTTVADVVAPLAASTEAAVQSAGAAQQQQITEGIQTRNTISKGNDELVGMLGETNDLLRNLNNTLPRSIAAAFQQSNP